MFELTMLKFISDTTDRLDKFLASKVDISRSRVQKAIKEGKVTVNGIIVLAPDFDVTVGSKIELPEFESLALKPSTIQLKVIYENTDMAVIDKPAGMVVHPGAGNTIDTLAQALMTRYPGIEKVGEPHRPGIVHRLDEDTSGLMLVAKTAAGYEYFKNLFLQREVQKEYLALVHGVPEKLHDVIDVPIAKQSIHKKMSVAGGTTSGGKVGVGKEAVTEYSVLAQSIGVDQLSLLRLKLHTGRTHQIRVHLSHIGHPIVGDSLYGARFKSKDAELIDRQFLHAYKLKFKLMDGTWFETVSDLPEELTAVLKKIGIKYDTASIQ